MNMSAKATKIMERYMKNYVTDTQLKKYSELGVITQDEYDYIYAEKHPSASVDEGEETQTEDEE